MTTLRVNDGGDFLFISSALLRTSISLRGKVISFPGTDGPRRFLLDGIFYESLIIKPSEIAGVERSRGPRALEVPPALRVRLHTNHANSAKGIGGTRAAIETGG